MSMWLAEGDFVFAFKVVFNCLFPNVGFVARRLLWLDVQPFEILVRPPIRPVGVEMHGLGK